MAESKWVALQVHYLRDGLLTPKGADRHEFAQRLWRYMASVDQVGDGRFSYGIHSLSQPATHPDLYVGKVYRRRRDTTAELPGGIFESTGGPTASFVYLAPLSEQVLVVERKSYAFPTIKDMERAFTSLLRHTADRLEGAFLPEVRALTEGGVASIDEFLGRVRVVTRLDVEIVAPNIAGHPKLSRALEDARAAVPGAEKTHITATGNVDPADLDGSDLGTIAERGLGEVRAQGESQNGQRLIYSSRNAAIPALLSLPPEIPEGEIGAIAMAEVARRYIAAKAGTSASGEQPNGGPGHPDLFDDDDAGA